MPSEPLSLWVVTENPSDFPGQYVARLWHGERATTTKIVAEDLKSIRREMLRRGLMLVPRSPEDDPVIFEIWL